MKRKRKDKRITGYIGEIPIYRGCEIHFNHFLHEQIGGNWFEIRDDLYNYGYTAAEVNEYRNKLLKDFYDFAKVNNLKGNA